MKNKYESSLLEAAKEARDYFSKFKKPNDEKGNIWGSLCAAIALYEQENERLESSGIPFQ